MKDTPQEELKNSLVRIRSFLIPGDDENKVMYLHAVVALAGSLSAFFILEQGELSLGMLEHTFLVLIEKTCVIVVLAYIISRTFFFKEILQKKFTLKNQILFVAAFGAISIFGTYSGIDIMGALANVRDLGPIIAGLIGGPWLGLAVGLIGGVHRFFLGGFTAVPCVVGTAFAGFLAGMVYYFNRGKFIGILGAVIFAALMESFHMILTLILAKPFPAALAVVQEVAGPMILANSMGVLIFAFIISNLLNEQKTKEERDEYLDELERHKYELQVAEKIQKSFLPNNIPSLDELDIAAVNLPAKESGGDFYDFIPISEHRFAVVIADVADRKVPAALVMAVSRTIVRSLTENTENLQVAELLKKLNRLITEKNKSNISLTLFYGVLDLKKKDMTYVNAGHGSPLVFKSFDKKIVSLEEENVLLGENKTINIEEKHMFLEKGDVIVFHTDGIYSVTDGEGNQFNSGIINDVLMENNQLPANEIIEKIKSSIKDFGSKDTLDDDICLIAMKMV